MEQIKTLRQYWLYVLLLEDNKYYVGVSTQPDERYLQHKRGFAGAAWTKKYKPIKMIDKKDLGIITYEEAEQYENKVVRAYIKKFGVNNVRGGDFRITEKYSKLFGRYIEDRDYEAIKVVLVLTTAMLFMMLLVFIK